MPSGGQGKMPLGGQVKFVLEPRRNLCWSPGENDVGGQAKLFERKGRNCVGSQVNIDWEGRGERSGRAGEIDVLKNVTAQPKTAKKDNTTQ